MLLVPSTASSQLPERLFAPPFHGQQRSYTLCAVQGKEQDKNFKLPSAVLFGMHLNTMHAEGMTYSHTHIFTRGGQGRVMVIVLVSRDCFGPGEKRELPTAKGEVKPMV